MNVIQQTMLNMLNSTIENAMQNNGSQPVGFPTGNGSANEHHTNNDAPSPLATGLLATGGVLLLIALSCCIPRVRNSANNVLSKCKSCLMRTPATSEEQKSILPTLSPSSSEEEI